MPPFIVNDKRNKNSHYYYGRSCLGHLPSSQLESEGAAVLLVASPLSPPSVGFDAIAQHQFLHAQYFQQQGVADKELADNTRDFLSRLYWGLSGEGTLGDWANFPSEGAGYLDVLPYAPDLPWPWVSEKDMDVIEAAYLSAGQVQAFRAGLASYRVADINWHIGEKFAAMNVDVPALLVAGELDPVMQAVNNDTL